MNILLKELATNIKICGLICVYFYAFFFKISGDYFSIQRLNENRISCRKDNSGGFNLEDFDPRSFQPTFISPQNQFTPRSIHPKFIAIQI